MHTHLLQTHLNINSLIIMHVKTTAFLTAFNLKRLVLYQGLNLLNQPSNYISQLPVLCLNPTTILDAKKYFQRFFLTLIQNLHTRLKYKLFVSNTISSTSLRQSSI